MSNEEKKVVFDETQPFLTDCLWVGSGKKVPFFHVVEKPDFNPRKTIDRGHIEELKSSILKQGLLQPLAVVEWKKGMVGGEDVLLYHVVKGHSRLIALRELLENGHEFKTLKFELIAKNTPEEKLYQIAYSDNISKPLNPADECEFFAKFIDIYKWNYTDLAERFGLTYQTTRMKAIVGQYGGFEMLKSMRKGEIGLVDAYNMISKKDDDNDIDKDEINQLNIEDVIKEDTLKFLDTFEEKRKKQLNEKKRKKLEEKQEWQRYHAIAIANIPDEDFSDMMHLITKLQKKYDLEIFIDKKTGKRMVKYDRDDIGEERPDIEVNKEEDDYVVDTVDN